MKDTKSIIFGGVAAGAVIILVLGMIIAGILVFRAGNMQTNTISVSGTSESEVTPDEAEIYLTIQTEGANSADVQRENSERSNRVISSLTSLGIDRKKIETTQYNLYPRQTYDRETGRSEIYGYTLTHTLKITIEDIENAGKYADAGVKACANSIQGVNFKLKTATEKKIREELLARAAGDAKGKAESIAKGLGAKLGRVVGASENQVYFPVWRNAVFAEKAVGDTAAAPMPTEIQPTTEKVSATVSVTYEIR